LANQLLIPELNIIEKEDIFHKKQYEIKELQVTIDDYEYISQFNVTTMYKEEIDIILGLPWFKKLGTFILNMEKRFVTFPYKKKMMTFQDITMKSDSIVPSSKDLKDISKVILQENRWSVSKIQKEYDGVIADKNEEISRLKDHSKKLLTQIKKSKDTKQCVQKLEQENQDLEKKLSEKEEESSRLTILNQRLLEQIKGLKEEAENQDTKKVEQSENEELACLKNHNQNLLTQIKKLKNDKKSLESKVEQLIKEASKSSEVKIQVVEKGTNTDPIHITTKEDVNPVEVKTYLKIPSEDPMTNQATSMREENHIPKLNQENATSMIRENHVIRTPYRHPNHKSRYLKQSEYQYHLGRERLTYRPKNIDTNAIKSHDNHSSWKCNVSKRLN
jgi:myosin heavy subunit